MSERSWCIFPNFSARIAWRSRSEIHSVALVPMSQHNLIVNLLHDDVGALPAALSMPQKSLHENRAARIQINHARSLVFGERLIRIPVPNHLLRAIPVHLRLAHLTDLPRHLREPLLKWKPLWLESASRANYLLNRMNTEGSRASCQEKMATPPAAIAFFS